MEEAEEAERAGLLFPSARDMFLSEAFRRLSAEMVMKGGKNQGGESEGIEEAIRSGEGDGGRLVVMVVVAVEVSRWWRW